MTTKSEKAADAARQRDLENQRGKRMELGALARGAARRRQKEKQDRQAAASDQQLKQ